MYLGEAHQAGLLAPLLAELVDHRERRPSCLGLADDVVESPERCVLRLFSRFTECSDGGCLAFVQAMNGLRPRLDTILQFGELL